MEELLKQIEGALEAQLYYLALLGALGLPDVCGALESDNGEASGNKYSSWFDVWVKPKYHHSGDEYFLTGADCYKFRCSMLHQYSSKPQKPNAAYSRLVFLEPSDSNYGHCNSMTTDDGRNQVTILNVDLVTFCRDIVCGVREWLKSVENTENYKRNSDKCIRRYPDGFKWLCGSTVCSLFGSTPVIA